MSINQKHLPALDGLRGLAVLMVIFFHLGLCRIGWVGVQIFFVLSGFLITRLLIAERDQLPLGQHLKLFYIRRALRIFPVYYAYLLLVLLTSYLAISMASTRDLLPSAAIYMQNIAVLVGHADGISDASKYATLHLWSLSVEENFYLFWPLLILVIKPKHYPLLIAGLVILTPAFRWLSLTYWADWFPASSPSEVNYIFTGSQLDAFATGAMINLLLPGILQSGRQASLGAFAFAIAAYLLLSNVGVIIGHLDVWLNPQAVPFDWEAERYYKDVWRYTIVNLLSAQLIVLALTHKSLAKFFTLRFMRWTGKISYGMYIVHAPMVYLAFGAEVYLKAITGSSLIATVTSVVGCLAAIYLLSDLSYRYLESRFLRLKPAYRPSEHSLTMSSEGARLA